MPFPNLEGKHAGRPYVTARRLLEYHESLGTARAAAPRAVVLTWQARLENRVRERRDHQQARGAGVDLSPYRETAEEIARYRAEGILTVEMEASCLFTVARVTGTAAAAAFVVSDVLHGEQREPHFGSADIFRGLRTLFEAAEACLSW